MASPETFVTTRFREPDLAKELDRGDRAAEAEVDEENPSAAQQRQLLRAHGNLGHPVIGEFCSALQNGRCRQRIVRWTKRHFQFPECDAQSMPRIRPAAALPRCYRFNQVCGMDTMAVGTPFNPGGPGRGGPGVSSFFPLLILVELGGVWPKTCTNLGATRLQLRLIVAKPILATPSQTRLVRACGFSISFHVQGPNGRI